ncbi:MAG: prepilin-type N-terminal cleavage/methylation domain-containing protein [Anaerolineales bacterium]
MFKRLMVEEDGFTLIELLVTIAILAVLFGIATLTLSGVGANAQTTVCAAELGVVQSAVDIYQANDPSATLTADSNTQITAGGGEFSDYLRRDTLGYYTWTAAGVVTQDSCP